MNIRGFYLNVFLLIILRSLRLNLRIIWQEKRERKWKQSLLQSKEPLLYYSLSSLVSPGQKGSSYDNLNNTFVDNVDIVSQPHHVSMPAGGSSSSTSPPTRVTLPSGSSADTLFSPV